MTKLLLNPRLLKGAVAAIVLALVAAAVVLLVLAQVVVGALGGGAGAMDAAAVIAARNASCNGAPSGQGGDGTGGPVTAIDVSKAPGQWSADQKANAGAIVEQVKVDVPPVLQFQAATDGLATAMQESNLHNVNYGDRDSLGLFQQRNAWASAAERLDPHKSAHMFLTGGHGGQRGLLDIPNWATMPVTQAAQAVQVSAFPLAYAKWEASARALARALLGAPSGPAPSASPTAAASPSPTTEDVSCIGSDPAATTGPSGPVSTTGWGNPMPAGAWVMTSPFGWRMHPVVHKMKLHTGVDLGAPNGTPVYAVHDGTVKAAAPNDGYGNQVVVAHGGGVDSAYNHLSVILVKAGQAVKGGQLVGKVGSTGMSTGNHLHFEIRLSEKPIDPVPFMRTRGVKLDVSR